MNKVVWLPLLQLVGAIADKILGLDPILTNLFHHMLWDRERGVMGQKTGQVWGWMLQRDFQGFGINGAHAQLGHILDAAIIDFLGIFDDVEDGRIFGGRGCGHDPLPRKHEVFSCYRLTIRPFGVA